MPLDGMDGWTVDKEYILALHKETKEHLIDMILAESRLNAALRLEQKEALQLANEKAREAKDLAIKAAAERGGGVHAGWGYALGVFALIGILVDIALRLK